MMVAGPSQCGKTTLVVRMIREQWFEPAPTRIFWLYKNANAAPRNALAGVNNVHFIEGLDASFERRLCAGTSAVCEPTLVVLDDLMSSLSNSDSLEGLFVEGSHHANATVIYLVQNLFQRSAKHRTAAINTHYLVVFKMPRDRTQVEVLARQMFGAARGSKRSTQFLQVYRDSTEALPHGYLLIDYRTDTPDHLRLRGEDASGRSIVYVLADDEPI